MFANHASHVFTGLLMQGANPLAILPEATHGLLTIRCLDEHEDSKKKRMERNKTLIINFIDFNEYIAMTLMVLIILAIVKHLVT